MNQGMEAIRLRLAGIESKQSDAQVTMARMQEDLAVAQRDLQAVREANTQLASHLDRLEQAQQSAGSDMANLQSRTLANQNRVDTLEYQVGRRQIHFEVLKDRNDEVASGIYLTIHRTNIAQQRVDGWLQLAKEGRFIRLRDVGAQQAVGFAPRGEERAYQVVFTQVGSDRAAGYLLIPQAPENTTTASK
jgi:hypothetical protein